MLELEVGKAPPFSAGQSDGVVLAQVVIRTVSGGVFNQDALIVLFGDDVHNSSHGVASVECRRGALHNLNPLNVLRVDERQVVFSSHVAVNPLSVNENEDVVVAQPVELHLRAHVALVEGERGGESAQDVFKGASSVSLEHFSADDFSLNRHVLQQVLCSGCRDDHFFQHFHDGIGFDRLSRQRLREAQQCHTQSESDFHK